MAAPDCICYLLSITTSSTYLPSKRIANLTNLRIDAGSGYVDDLDICAPLEEAGKVVEHGEDHDEDDEVTGPNVEPAE